MRFSSTFFSSLAVFFIFFSGVKLRDYVAGLIASTIFILSNLQLEYAHLVRSYSLLVLLSSASIFIIIRLIKEEHKYDYLFLALINTLLLYTHFMGLIYVVFLFLIIFFYWGNKAKRTLLWRSFLITLLLFTPYLPVFFSLLTTNGSASWLNTPTSINQIYQTLRIFSNAPVVAVTVIVFVILGIECYFWRKKNRLLQFLFIQLLCTFFGVYLLALITPIYLSRYLIYIAPILYLFLGSVSVEISSLISHKALKIIPLLILPIMFLFSFKIDSDINKSDKHIWEQVEKIRGESALILDYSTERNFAYSINKERYYLGSIKQFSTALKSDNVQNKKSIWYSGKTPDTVFVYSRTTLDTELEQKLEEKYSARKEVYENLFCFFND